MLDEILEKLPEEFNMGELQSKVEDKTPYVLVALQECERMNNLTREIRRSLKELNLGLKVSLCVLYCMYIHMNCIFLCKRYTYVYNYTIGFVH